MHPHATRGHRPGRRFWFAFGAVYRREGGKIDHQIGPFSGDRGIHGRRTRDIGRLPIKGSQLD